MPSNSDTRTAPADFLLRQLRSCSGPILYRSGVSRLLSLPDQGGQQMDYPLPVPPVGFRYQRTNALDSAPPPDVSALHLSDAFGRQDRPKRVVDAAPNPPAADERGRVRSDGLSGHGTSFEHSREVDEQVAAQPVAGGSTTSRHVQDLPGGTARPSAGQLQPVDVTIPSVTRSQIDGAGRPVSASMPDVANPNLLPAPRPHRSQDDVAPSTGDGPRRPLDDVPAADGSRAPSQPEPVCLPPQPAPASSSARPPTRRLATDAPTVLPRPQSAQRQQVEQLRDAARRIAQPGPVRQETLQQPSAPPVMPPSASAPPAPQPSTVRRPPRMGSGIPRAFWASSTLRSTHLGVLR
jgi:hypothetical protein